MRMSGRPQATSASPKTVARRRPFQRHRAERSDQPADADRRRQVADLPVAAVEDLEHGHDDQHVHATANEGLRDDQADDHRRSLRVEHGAEAAAEQPPDARVVAVGGEIDASFDPDEREHRGAREQNSGGDGEDDARVRDARRGRLRGSGRPASRAPRSSTSRRSRRSALPACARATAAAPGARA